MEDTAPPFILHATAPLGGLPASDIESLYYAAVLQRCVPGRWAVQQGDWGSNGGRLPYVTHLDHIIPLRDLPHLPGWSDVDADLDEKDRCDGLVWRGYVEQTLTDLVNHTLYSLPPNYPALLAPAQTAPLGPLERHYIPQRIRAIHRARLEHVGLWGLGGLNYGDARAEDQARLNDSFIAGPAGTQAPRAWSGWRSGRETEERRRQFGAEEVRQRARAALDIISRRLESRGRRYFAGDTIGSADLYLFAHLSLLLTPPYPNALLPDLIRAEYPSLITHTERVGAVLGLTTDSATATWTVARAPTPASAPASIQATWTDAARGAWASVSPFASARAKRTAEAESQAKAKTKAKPKSEMEKRMERGRWMWFLGAGAAMLGYVFAAGLVRVEFGEGAEGLEWEEVDGDEDEEGDGDGDAEDSAEEEIIIVE